MGSCDQGTGPTHQRVPHPGWPHRWARAEVRPHILLPLDPADQPAFCLGTSLGALVSLFLPRFERQMLEELCSVSMVCLSPFPCCFRPLGNETLCMMNHTAEQGKMRSRSFKKGLKWTVTCTSRGGTLLARAHPQRRASPSVG